VSAVVYIILAFCVGIAATLHLVYKKAKPLLSLTTERAIYMIWLMTDD